VNIARTAYSWKSYFLLSLAFALTFFSTGAWIVHTWFSQRGAHGPVIAAISIYMIWTKRHQLQQLTMQPQFLLGLGVLVTGCMMLIAGRLSSLLLLQYLSFIITLLGLVLLIGGVQCFKILVLPIAYLVFTFPLFSELLESVSVYLQTFTAWIAYILLKLTSIPVYRSGIDIELPQVSLEVARECNGINHMVALVGLAIPLAYWTQNTFIRKTGLIVSGLFIAMIANGTRVAFIGILAYFYPGASLHGPYALFYVSFVFFFGMILLLLMSRVMGWRQPKKTDGQPSHSAVVNISSVTAIQYSVKSIAIAVVILIATSAYLYFYKPVPVFLSRSLSAFPTSIGQWVGHDTDLSEPPFNEFIADTELKRIYRDDHDNEMKLYIGYFPMQKDDKEVVSWRFDPLQRGAVTMKMPIGTDVVSIKKLVLQKSGRTEHIYFYYDINGKIVVNRYAAKLATLFDAFLHRRTNAAIVVLSLSLQISEGKEDEGYDIEFLKEVFPIIQRYLV
jgi:EpsI family protein